MAKHTITYNQLYAIDQDLNRLRVQSPALMLLLHKYINNYLKHAGMELKILYKKLDEYHTRYCEKKEDGSLQVDENGEIVFKKTVSDIANARILSGDEVKEAYLKEAGDFLNRSCTIDL
jgi:hypothetical protein